MRSCFSSYQFEKFLRPYGLDPKSLRAPKVFYIVGYNRLTPSVISNF